MKNLKNITRGLLSIIVLVATIVSITVFAYTASSEYVNAYGDTIEFYIGNEKQSELELTVGESKTVTAKISFDLSTSGSGYGSGAPSTDQMPTTINITSDNDDLEITPTESEVLYEYDNDGSSHTGYITKEFELKANSVMSDVTLTLTADLNNEYSEISEEIKVSAVEKQTDENNSETDETETTGNENKTDETEKEKIKYQVLEGANQKFDLNGTGRLRFRFNIEYSKFLESGKVFVDGEVTDSSNYESSEGSTVIVFTKAYTDKLKAGNHTLKVTVDDGEVDTKFDAVKNASNPQTNDNIKYYVTLFAISLIVGFSLY